MKVQSLKPHLSSKDGAWFASVSLVEKAKTQKAAYRKVQDKLQIMQLNENLFEARTTLKKRVAWLEDQLEGTRRQMAELQAQNTMMKKNLQQLVDTNRALGAMLTKEKEAK